MRKISEIIKLALPFHAAALPDTNASLGLCFVLNNLRRDGLATEDEICQVKDYLYWRILEHNGRMFGYLFKMLKAQKKASNLAARVAFYQRLVTKLEKKGL